MYELLTNNASNFFFKAKYTALHGYRSWSFGHARLHTPNIRCRCTRMLWAAQCVANDHHSTAMSRALKIEGSRLMLIIDHVCHLILHPFTLFIHAGIFTLWVSPHQSITPLSVYTRADMSCQFDISRLSPPGSFIHCYRFYLLVLD